MTSMEVPVADRVEKKVVASTAWATAVTLVLTGVIAVLNAVQADPSLLGDLPVAWQSVIVMVVPTLLTLVTTFGAGYQTRSNRTLS